ncbi:hypothetical protein H3S80_07110 [Bartonella sp. M0177]|uniref:hypothetical protein n=1 Tax=Bartonella sp. M0177 TaxID=2750940 RepID=UPI0018DDDA1D|nr:hypothetical protein [Bartonella sp. M0177]MBI0003816.1 hypothetical protein [Bartonella sp. M0177]
MELAKALALLMALIAMVGRALVDIYLQLDGGHSTGFTFREKYAVRLGWAHCRQCLLKPTCVFYLPFKLELE